MKQRFYVARTNKTHYGHSKVVNGWCFVILDCSGRAVDPALCTVDTDPVTCASCLKRFGANA